MTSRLCLAPRAPLGGELPRRQIQNDRGAWLAFICVPEYELSSRANRSAWRGRLSTIACITLVIHAA